MRHYTAFTILLMCAVCSYAIPAKKSYKQTIQPSGILLTIELRGDEHPTYYVTEDNIPVVEHENGEYCYPTIMDGMLQPSSIIAKPFRNRSEEEKNLISELNNSDTQLTQLRTQRVMEKKPDYVATRSTLNRARKIIGEKKGLVILVNFKDNSFSQTNPKKTFDGFMNEAGYKENGQYGSVYDYFFAQSEGQFSLNFDVVGPITLSQNMEYYGANDRFGDDIRPGTMTAEACLAVQDSVDFSRYDWDGDGIVDQVYILYAGYNEAQGANKNTIWPHEWTLKDSEYGRALIIDNVIVNTYACSSELTGKSGTTIDGIGTTCHEFSHCLGLPDFYDTSGSNNFGMDRWSIMDYGCYGDDGNRPCGFTSYEKWACGWKDPIELNEACSILDMESMSDNGAFYIIYNEAYKNEYYLLYS